MVGMEALADALGPIASPLLNQHVFVAVEQADGQVCGGGELWGAAVAAAAAAAGDAACVCEQCAHTLASTQHVKCTHTTLDLAAGLPAARADGAGDGRGAAERRQRGRRVCVSWGCCAWSQTRAQRLDMPPLKTHRTHLHRPDARDAAVAPPPGARVRRRVRTRRRDDVRDRVQRRVGHAPAPVWQRLPRLCDGAARRASRARRRRLRRRAVTLDFWLARRRCTAHTSKKSLQQVPMRAIAGALLNAAPATHRERAHTHTGANARSKPRAPPAQLAKRTMIASPIA